MRVGSMVLERVAMGRIHSLADLDLADLDLADLRGAERM